MTVSDKNCNSHPGCSCMDNKWPQLRNERLIQLWIKLFWTSNRGLETFHDQTLIFCGILLTLFWRYLVLPSLQCLLIHLRNGRVFNDWRLGLIMYWDLTWTGFKSLYISGPDSNDLRLDSWTEPKSLSFAFTCRQNPQKRLQLCSALFSLLFPFHIKHHSPADLISGNMLCTDFLTGPLRNSGYCSSHHSNCSPSLPFGGPGMKLSPLSSDRNPLPPAASRHSSPAVSSSHTHAAS